MSINTMRARKSSLFVIITSFIPLAPPTIETPLSTTEAAAFFVVSTVL